MTDFNAQIIDEFRSTGGTVTTMGFGDALLLLHTIGARSGEPRTSPLMHLTEDHDHLIIGSAAGAPRNPAWVHNLRARPQARIEVPGDGTTVETGVTATELTDDDWDAAWTRFLATSPAFAEYTTSAEGRRFPIFRLSPNA